MSEKTSNWIAKRGRKLRVVFVDDVFWGYVDLPSNAGAPTRLRKEFAR